MNASFNPLNNPFLQHRFVMTLADSTLLPAAMPNKPKKAALPVVDVIKNLSEVCKATHDETRHRDIMFRHTRELAKRYDRLRNLPEQLKASTTPRSPEASLSNKHRSFNALQDLERALVILRKALPKRQSICSLQEKLTPIVAAYIELSAAGLRSNTPAMQALDRQLQDHLKTMDLLLNQPSFHIWYLSDIPRQENPSDPEEAARLLTQELCVKILSREFSQYQPDPNWVYQDLAAFQTLLKKIDQLKKRPVENLQTQTELRRIAKSLVSAVLQKHAVAWAPQAKRMVVNNCASWLWFGSDHSSIKTLFFSLDRLDLGNEHQKIELAANLLGPVQQDAVDSPGETWRGLVACFNPMVRSAQLAVFETNPGLYFRLAEIRQS
ncbi:MAG: hypothetical protein H7A33_08040 [Deltaproteobacteria bacterium]|nr:hypothetical protein [Deltaproteobacteria bacterium]